MILRVAAWLAVLMMATAVVLFLLGNDFSGPVGLLLLGGVVAATVAIAIGVVRWRPTASDPDAEAARSRLEWIWRSGYGGNRH